MGIRTKGFDSLGLTLRQTGERAERRAREQMKREGEKIADIARTLAPVDYEGQTHGSPPARELERSIEAERSYEDNRRLTITVSAGGVVDGVDVDEYAGLMHEGLAPYGSGAYLPGPATRAKGGKAGGKFLERAFLERKDKLVAAITAAIRKGT